MKPTTGSDKHGRIVIIEDDFPIRRGLEINLSMEGYEVFGAKDGEAGLALTKEKLPDLVILDVMLPGLNGYEVLNELRRRSPNLAVLMLTAKSAEDDKILGLDLGADDYMVKPFSLRELLSRVNAQVRRHKLGAAAPITFSDVSIDGEAQRVSRGGVTVEMSKSEYALLRVLVERPGRVQSRQALIDAAWKDNYDGTDRTIDNFVVKLRQKLEPNPEQPRHFITVRGQGYRFDP